jgi:NAD+ kinase
MHTHQAPAPHAGVPSCLGVVVHPSRNIDRPLTALRKWSADHRVDILQIPVSGQDRRVAEVGEPAECDLVVAIGGDGTMLAAIRAAVTASRPVMGVASGSLGALAAVTVADVASALDRFSRGEWEPLRLPALHVRRDDGREIFAINDIAIVRAAEGQVRTTAAVDGTLFARFAGDGCIVSTPVGSSAYALSARGPLLTPDVSAFLLTPLPAHGGVCPPLVISARSKLELGFVIGHGGARLEVDGQLWMTDLGSLTVTLRGAVATSVKFADSEPFITGLRRRNVILDSPRILAEETCPDDFANNS